MHSQDGATPLTQIFVDNRAIPSLDLQVTCDTYLPAPIDHECKNISVVTENVDSCSPMLSLGVTAPPIQLVKGR